MKCGRKGGREERGLRNGRLEGRDGGMGREKNKSLLFCRIVRELLKSPTYSIYPFNPAIQCLHIDLGKKEMNMCTREFYKMSIGAQKHKRTVVE